ncbi:DUF559 domain-containing protein [Lentibacillus lipolyticus]|nr:DUF559 domain-containing protein [Lentibacillus lipolyticus]
MINSIAESCPELLDDWDYQNNDYDPIKVTTGSDKRIHWMCHVCGHKWVTEAKNRAGHGHGCKECKRRWNTSFNELSLSYYLKQLFKSVESGYQLKVKDIKEVDIYIPDLNVVVEYDSFYYHENREETDSVKTKILTEHGYSVIRLREKGLSKIKDATNIFFELGPNSKFEKQTIRYIIKYICNNLLGLENQNKKIDNLSIDADRDQLHILRQVRPVETSPNLLKENAMVASCWDDTKNNPFKPQHFKPSSNFKVWWICSENNNHSWRTQINVRNKGHGCPYCAGIRVTPEKSLSVVKPDLAKEWDYFKNDVHPDDVAAYSNKEYWWLCPGCHSSYDNALNERMAGENCPYCAGKRVNHTNSLRAKFPEVAKEWHPTGNGDLTPDDVTYGYSKKVWWKCKRGHEWESPVYSRTTGNKSCKECYEQYGRSKPRVVRCMAKSLLYKAPDIASQWHPALNDVGPEKVGRSARHEYWWLCNNCGHEWTKAPNSRRSSRCPKCKERPS